MTIRSIQGTLRRDRAVILSAIAAISMLAWAYVLWLASTMNVPAGTGSGMSGMDMGGMAAPTLHTWGPIEFALMFAMWAVMMIGMMLPSATPMLLIYGSVVRQAKEQGKPFAPTAWFAGGYMLVWIAFALLATLAQWALESTLLLTPMMNLAPMLGGVVLIVAGLYQWTPLKDMCLSTCQNPLQFIMRHGGFRPDAAASLTRGVEHGLYCVGCCWALMAILFVVGIMNVLWIAAIAVFVLLEKIVPAVRWLSRLAGILFMLAGAWMLLDPSQVHLAGGMAPGG